MHDEMVEPSSAKPTHLAGGGCGLQDALRREHFCEAAHCGGCARKLRLVNLRQRRLLGLCEGRLQRLPPATRKKFFCFIVTVSRRALP